MFVNIKKSCSLLLSAAVFALVACGGGNAHAAAVNAQTYDTSSGTLISMQGVLSLENTSVAGNIYVTYLDGSTALIPDNSGVAFSKIRADNPQLVQWIYYWVNPNVATRITCVSGFTTFVIIGTGLKSFNDPGCVMYSQIRANSK